MRHGTSAAPLTLTALVLLALGCGDGPQPTAPTSSSDAAPEPVSATAGQAAEEDDGPGRSFAFFPPLRPASDPPGPFDAEAAPVAEICRLADGSCAGEPVERFTPEGKGSQRVRASEGKFIVSWHAKRSSLPTAPPSGCGCWWTATRSAISTSCSPAAARGRGKARGRGGGPRRRTAR